MRLYVKRTINYVLVIIFFILGVTGIVLPVIPGLIFFVLGTVILSYEIPFIERELEKRINKETKFGTTFFKYKNKFEKYFK